MASKEDEINKRGDIKSRQVLLEDVRTKRYSKSFSYVPTKIPRGGGGLNLGVRVDYMPQSDTYRGNSPLINSAKMRSISNQIRRRSWTRLQYLSSPEKCFL
jgi:hypothetical protein